VKACAACGEQNPDKAKFCLECGGPLPEATPGHEERKVVTVLFADLVGFTRRSEAMDVEDVRGTLVPYHRLLRRELERYGGTVEKFIGDAVMAVFGAPIAHEDDAERAVRAALAIQEAVARLRDHDERLDLHVRIGVNTGEALIALDANPASGEGMASGDVVNTAARLQAAAPVDGVLVGEVTYRATTRAIAYDAAPPIQAKGKSDPVTVWVATQARSRLGSDVQQAPSTPLVGRERELRLLWEAFERSRAEGAPQLVTMVGVPGIGKSRLVWELLQRVDAEPALTTWRQGRSLPYGEGVAFWALGEMVKAQAGVLDSDLEDETSRKLHETVADLIDERDAAWTERHLRPLVGLEGDPGASDDQRTESFAAWRRFLEALAARGPTVIVFEDLHWADDALLDFVDHLVEWASGVPLLVLCTARPELLERRSGWGGGKPNALTVALSPLSEPDTARLIGALLEQALLPAETQAALLERADGNPLYAEEYVRMLIDRGALVRDGAHWRMRAERLEALPESVQAIIAARLDALSSEEKAAVQAAAVVGKVVWLGAVEAIAGVSRWKAEELLHRLERKEFVRRERQSVIAGETEYAFRHILARDVAYAQIPRAARAARHEQAANWIESLSGGRDDRIELLAHHRLRALEYARATGTDHPALVSGARAALAQAGEHALLLNGFAAAASLFASALELSPPPQERARLLHGLGRARMESDDVLAEELVAAASELERFGDLDRALDAEVSISVWHSNYGHVEAAQQHLDRATALARGLPPSRTTARALLAGAMRDVLSGRHQLALQAANAAIEHDDATPETALTARALRAVAMLFDDDPAGLAELRPAVERALDLRSNSALVWGANLADCCIWAGDPAAAADLASHVADLAERLAVPFGRRVARIHVLRQTYAAGEWDVAWGLAERLVDDVGWHGGSPNRSVACVARAQMRSARGDEHGARADAAAAVSIAATGEDPDWLFPALALRARLLAEAGDQAADADIDQLLATWRGRLFLAANALPDLAVACVRRGRAGPLRELLLPVRVRTPWLVAAQAATEERWADTASALAAAGAMPEEAYARMLAARSGGPAAAGELEKALPFWRRVGATAYLREAADLLGPAASSA
jgi:class 3 adenylate cyclase